MTIARWLLLAFILAGNFVSTSALAQSVPGVPFGRSCPERFPADGNLGAAFFDAGWQSCWSCPVGYNRSAAPVTAVNGCSKAITAQHSKATRTGTFTCAGKYGEGAFEDSYDDGSCWKCPPDAPTRTWDPVYSATACQQASFTNRKPAIRVGKPTCESGFKDSFEGGTCWTCPPGYNRTALHVSWSGDQACEKTEEIAPGVQRGRQDDPPVSDCPAAPAVPNPSDMTLFVATDLHFGKEDAGGIVTSQSLLRHVAEMNALPSRNVKWPNPGFASDVIGEPVAIVTTGDNTHYGQSWQFEFFRWLYEPEQRTLKNYPDAIKWPVFVGNGNHDIAGDCYMNNCALRSYNYITTRHRAGCMGVTNFHDGSHNYSWDMNGIHFVQLHTWAGDTRLGANGTHEPGLDWLKADRARRGR